MNPSVAGTQDATHKLIQESLQLQEYANQLQVHFEMIEQELSHGGSGIDQSRARLSLLQEHLRQIDEHVAQMRG